MDVPLRQSALRIWIGNRRYWLAGAAVILALTTVAVYFYLTGRARDSAASFATAPAVYGDVTQTVSANGTLNPVIEVNVGSQVSGTVQKLYVDFNSRVRKGQVLLTLDPTLLKAQLAQSTANLHNAEANLLLTKTNEARIAPLVKSGYASQSELDQALANRKVAEAQVELAAAQLQRDRTNLDYTVIRSPVDGVVINRVVDVGQTVAASFQTPTLFVIGQNLRAMQIDVTVDEADVGQIHAGQRANFTVDAYPERKFVGTVSEVRLNPTIVQNVVTYDVVVSVDNRDETLLPGMTAYVDMVVLQRRHVLLVPNAALRVHVPGATGAAAAGSTLYVLENGRPRRIAVKTGASDGQQTEILAGGLRPGDSVITGFTAAAQAKRGPFQLF
ncbi:MAG TPA: efflux RND transporter periplasmic adaptor subunit [Gammaproteobacteria bacterium]|nr:efflux RND transporter periplasmic adaptor subunit [Gammaproteobacteria bacterium]